ncbi:hypothetical protein [Methanosphaera cuniculi]|uniref:hypothetical protein n=1 Tax=Methanosphaera cuniculi TaxID=1077256 RepID=UPI0026EEB718|nr:hypothetical protein [Methanosphaera cuniculi]
MIDVETIKTYASSVLISTIEDLFDNKKELIDTFFDEFVDEYKDDRKLNKDYKDNEVVDEYIIDELEKRFTQNDIGQTLQKQMVKANDEAIADLAYVLDEKLQPIQRELRRALKTESSYDAFRKYVTENLVVTNLNLTQATIKAVKTMKLDQMQAAEIMQLISQIDN